MKDMEISYEKLFAILKKRKISNARLVREAGLVKTDLLVMECHDVLPPTTIIKLCDYLNLDVFDIMEVKEERKEDEVYVYL